MEPTMEIRPVTLTGRHICLDPLSLEHLDGLTQVGLDPELWLWTVSQVCSREQMAEYIQAALQLRQEGSALPFATVERATGRVVGSTRYMNIDRPNRHVEIGSTWVAPQWQRTPVNTEAKYLMLRHAFEELGCIRVELKTDSLNEKSRAAILRIGAREEGIFRNHMLCWGGRIRHSAWYSIIDSEWPGVKAKLEERLSY
jgi:RimJ/RimL family protein N-acetyltransferase